MSARAVRQQRPQAANEIAIGLRSFEHDFAAVEQGLHAAEQRGAVIGLQHLLHILDGAWPQRPARPFEHGQVAAIVPRRRKSRRDRKRVAEMLVDVSRHEQESKRECARSAGIVRTLIGDLHHGNLLAIERPREHASGARDARRPIAEARCKAARPGAGTPRGTQVTGQGIGSRRWRHCRRSPVRG